MFFDLLLLNAQHRGRFGYAWLAGTRGIQHLQKKKIMEVDVSKLCDQVSEFVNSNADSPRKRFSLRLSAILINGIVKIHYQQGIYMIDDINKLLSTVSTPISLKSIEEDEMQQLLNKQQCVIDPPSPIIRVVKKKRPRGDKKEKVTPSSLLSEELEELIAEIAAEEGAQLPLIIPELPQDQIAPTARAEEITMPEDQPVVQEPMEPDEFDHMDETEREQMLIDAPPIRHSAITEPVPMDIEEPEPILPPVDVVPEPPTEEEMSPVLLPGPGEPEKRTRPRRTPAQIETTAEVHPIPTSVRSSASSSEELPGAAPAEIPEPRRAKKAPRITVQFKTPKYVTIDRCKITDEELMEIEYPFDRPIFRMTCPDLQDLINFYMVDDTTTAEMQLRTTETPTSMTDSMTMQQQKPGQVTPEPEVQTPLTPSKRRPTDLQVTVEETITRVPDAGSPRKRPRLLVVDEPQAAIEPDFVVEPVEPEIPAQKEFVDTEPEGFPYDVESVVPVPEVLTDDQKLRHHRIVGLISIRGKDQYTIEELCPSPINRMNIALTFCDLLALSANGYVNLVSEADSTALAYIEKGPKMEGRVLR